VYFHIDSHGYEYPKDGFGNQGIRLRIELGGEAVISIKRINVAERLYRITGQGIYRDSYLLGEPVPIEQSLINGLVMGQDTVMTVRYRDQLFWFWGDTDRVRYPLGQFAVSGAVSSWPPELNPADGVNLKYFVDDSGFSRRMCPMPGPGVVWIEGLMTLQDPEGNERLVAQYARFKDLGHKLEVGLTLYNDELEVFEKWVEFSLDETLVPRGNPLRAEVAGKNYYYFGLPHPCPVPSVRVVANWEAVQHPEQYEVFTPFAAGSREFSENASIERDPSGNPIWAWKSNARVFGQKEQRAWIRKGKLKPKNAWIYLRDIESGKQVYIHAGSVFWNEYRNRWILIGEESGGSSLLGEIWYAEADSVTGPWVYSRKIVSHNRYSFYNPTQHPYFDQQGGQWIYFEGTYTSTFSSASFKTPRYDYNQMMYRLDLGDPRVVLPCPIYRIQMDDSAVRYVAKSSGQFPRHPKAQEIDEIPFFALPPERPREGMDPIYEIVDEESGHLRLSADSLSSINETSSARLVFFASIDEENRSDLMVPLYEYRDISDGRTIYSTQILKSGSGGVGSRRTICYVWKNPGGLFLNDWETRAIQK